MANFNEEEEFGLGPLNIRGEPKSAEEPTKPKTGLDLDSIFKRPSGVTPPMAPAIKPQEKPLQPQIEGVTPVAPQPAKPIPVLDAQSLDAIGKPEMATDVQPALNGPQMAVETTKRLVDPTAGKQFSDSANAYVKAQKALMEAGLLDEEAVADYTGALANYASQVDPSREGSVANAYFEKMEGIKSEIRESYKEILEINKQKIDPDRYIKNMSTGSKVLGVLSSMFDTYMRMQGKIPANTKTFADVLKEEIDRDVKLQFEDIRANREGASEKYKLLNDELSRHSSEANARLAMEAKYMEAAASKLESRIKAQNLTDVQRANVETEITKLRMGVAQKIMDATSGSMKIAPTAPSGGISPEKVWAMRKDINKREIKIPQFDEDGKLLKDENNNAVYRTFMAKNAEDVSKMDTQIAANTEAIQILDRVDDVRKRWSAGEVADMDSEIRGELESLSTQAMMSLKESLGLGAITAPDERILDKLVPAFKAYIMDENYAGAAKALRWGMINKIKQHQIRGANQTPENYVKSVFEGLGAERIAGSKFFSKYRSETEAYKRALRFKALNARKAAKEKMDSEKVKGGIRG